MKEIHRVMVAMEFSDNTHELFAFAAGLAAKMDADLLAVNVINIRDVDAISRIAAMGYEISAGNYVEKLEEERKEILDSMVQGSKFSPQRFKAVFKVGNPAETLIRVALEEKADLMVLGIKAHTELERFLVGSVAEKMFRRSPITVVSFRDEKSAQRLKKRFGPD